MDNWISVETLPPIETLIDVFTSTNGPKKKGYRVSNVVMQEDGSFVKPSTKFIKGHKIESYCKGVTAVTHWMKIPAAPGEPAPQSEPTAALGIEAKLREALEITTGHLYTSLKTYSKVRGDSDEHADAFASEHAWYKKAVTALSDTPPVAVVSANSVAVPVEELKQWLEIVETIAGKEGLYEAIQFHITAAKQKEAGNG